VAASVLLAVVAAAAPALANGGHVEASTLTPIKHLVVIYQENVSFDHYFATYPRASNPAGEPRFTPQPGTPSVNGLNASLLAPNTPNSVQSFRLGRDQAQTCDQDHSYTAEQRAFDSGLMDKFVETVGRGAGACADYGKGKGLVMGYYDGNTVTGLWNYAQHFAMSDNSYGTTFGPSTPGALNLVAGQTHGFTTTSPAVTANTTVIGDPQPTGDTCDTRDTTTSTDPNKNIGDLLNAKGTTWGWFQGGFADCAATHADVGGVTSKDYIPHHEPFQYYASTANLQHTRPASVSEIGHAGQANHQYDLTDFWSSVDMCKWPEGMREITPATSQSSRLRLRRNAVLRFVGHIATRGTPEPGSRLRRGRRVETRRPHMAGSWSPTDVSTRRGHRLGANGSAGHRRR
jgi:phospholipase C